MALYNGKYRSFSTGKKVCHFSSFYLYHFREKLREAILLRKYWDMTHFFRYPILGALCGVLLNPSLQAQDINPPPPKQASKKHPPIAKAVLPVPPTPPTPVSSPLIPKALKTKTQIIDARELTGQKLINTIKHIQENANIRFKLQNMTNEAEFVVPLLQNLKDKSVLDRILDINFVITNQNNAVLNEKEFISRVLPFLTHVEKIELNCLGVTDTIVKAIANTMPHLTSISLWGEGITDVTVTTLAAKLPNLIKIHLINTGLTSLGVQTLKAKFPKLEDLGLSGGAKDLKSNQPKLTDIDFALLTKKMPNLRSFSVQGQQFKDQKTIVNLLQGAVKLQSLNLSETNTSDEITDVIPHLSHLKSLDISETLITKQGVRKIAQQSLDLTTLKMNGLKGIGGEELKFIATKQTALKTFHFSGVDFNNLDLMVVLLNLPNLTDVTLIPTPESKWILTDAVAAALVHHIKKLQYLHIQAGRLPEELRRYLKAEIPTLHIEYQP